MLYTVIKNKRKGDKPIAEKCSFCGKTIRSRDVERMIQSPTNPDVYICNRCTEQASNIFFETLPEDITERRKKEREDFEKMLPTNIHYYLDQHIIGQEKAKKILSVAIYNHYKRLHDETGLIKKSNILLVGPSGSGKTLLAQTIANILGVPFAIADATSLTEAGYVGDDVETIIQKLISNAHGDVKLAEEGIIFIDEIDKLAKSGESPSISRDVGHYGVQASLLKLIEGSEVLVPVNGTRKHPSGQNVLFNTKNVLFICGGAFDGLMNDSSNTSHPIGFNSVTTDNAVPQKNELSQETLIKYGMIPEFIGRLPILCPLSELSEEDLVRVLTEPKDSIVKEYQSLFQIDGIELIFEKDALKRIASLAIQRKIGARGVRSILEDVMLETMYLIPNKKDKISKCIITEETIETKNPVIELKKAVSG